MADLIENGGFEGAISPPWNLVHNAAASTAKKRSGLQSLRLQTNFGGIPPNQGDARQAISNAVDGESYDALLYFNASAAGPLGGTSIHRIELQIENQFGGFDVADFYQFIGSPPDDFSKTLSATFAKPPINPFEIRLTTRELGSGHLGVRVFYADDVEVLGVTQGELVARSNMSTFLDNLKGVIEAVDINVGKVFLAERRWSQSSDLVDDGAQLRINPGGLWDGIEELGPATRFWILEPWVEPTPLTNCSAQWRGIVNVLGFYGWKENHSQAETLRDAALEIVAELAEKTTELTTLAVGMGSGYMGYLTELPKMLGPVRAAQLLGTSGQGHAVQISAGYFEEVSRD